MKRTLFLVMTVMAFCGAWSQNLHDPDTYYSDATNKTGNELKSALSDIINPHTTLGYKSLNGHYATTDTDADGYLIDIYSVKKKYKVTDTNTGTEGTGYNKEHTVPSSWFSKKSPMYSDIFHVLPTDSWVNSKRGNLPYGEISAEPNSNNSSYDHFSKWGPCKSSIGYSGDVFEPNDEYKGDIARIYFYMATCYEDELRSSTWSGGMFTANGFSDWAKTMLMRWAKEDPVSQKEKDRNNAVDKIQHNRNPFVDFPGLEEYIWGNKTTTPFDPLNYNGSSSETVARPVISPAGGNFTEPVSVSITCSTAGAVIYYTTDGTAPTTSSTLYNAAFTVSEATTVKAYAVHDGNSSAVTTATFTFSQGGQGDENIIWAEDWESGSNQLKVEDIGNPVAEYIGDGGSFVKIYTSTMEGGGSWELLIPKNSRSINYFIATIDLGNASGEMDLTFNSNNNNLQLTSTTSGVTIGAGTYQENVYSFTITVPQGTSSLALKFATTSDKNTRVDNFMLTGEGQGATELIPVTLEFSEDEATATIGEDFTEPTLTITPSNANITVVYASDNETVATVDAATGEVTPHNEGVATIIASFEGNNTYMAAEDATYTLTVNLSGQPLHSTGIYQKITSVSDLEDGKNYLIVYEPDNAAYKMFNKDKGEAGEVAIVNHQIDMNSDSNYAAILVLEKSGDNWLIKEGDKYLALTSNSNTLNQQSNASDAGTEWSITFNENDDAVINNVTRNTYYLQYNTSGLFRCYKNTQQHPMLYKEILKAEEGVSLTIGATGYASLYYGEVNLVVPEGVEATTYNVSNGKLMVSKTYEEGDIIPAGTAVIVYDGLSTTETYTFDETTETGTAPEFNMLKGFDENATTVGDDEGTAYKFYMLAVDNETKDPASVGFYYGADGGAPFISKAHRAYLAVPATAAKGMKAFPFNNALGITAPETKTQTGKKAVYSLSGQRMNAGQLPKGVYVRDGKKYVVK